MKKGIIFLIVLIIIILILNLFYINFVFNEKNIHRNYEQFLQTDKNNLKIIFFGDSHPARAINPKYINKSFNFAVPSEIYEQTFIKVKWILENYPTVDTFVIPYDYHSFNSYRSNPYYDKKHWLNFISVKSLSKLSNSSQFAIMVDKYLPIIGKGTEILSYVKNKENKTEIYLGWQKETKEFTDNENMTKSAINRVDSQLVGYPDIKDKKLFNSFIKTIYLLEKNDKKIILIKYPLTEEYLSAVKKKGLNNTSFYQEEQYLLENIKKLYILDYQDYFSKNKTIFSDQDHLNDKGAKVFSKKVNEDLKELNKTFFFLEKETKNLDSPRPSDILAPYGRNLLS